MAKKVKYKHANKSIQNIAQKNKDKQHKSR